MWRGALKEETRSACVLAECDPANAAQNGLQTRREEPAACQTAGVWRWSSTISTVSSMAFNPAVFTSAGLPHSARDRGATHAELVHTRALGRVDLAIHMPG